MINSNEKTRLGAARRVSRSVSRVGKWALRLTCLFALLLALSPSSKAWDCYINGLESNGVKMNGSTNDFTYTYTPTSNDTKYIYLWDGKAGDGGKDIGPYTKDETISFSNNTFTYDECHENSNKWKFEVSTNYTYSFTYWNEYGGKHRLQITRTARQTQTTTPTIIGDWPGHTADWTGAGTNMTWKSEGWYEYALTPTTDGTIYFRIKNGDTQYYPNDSDNVEITTADAKYETKTTSNSKSFYLNAIAGKKYYVKYYPNDSNKVAVYWEGSNYNPKPTLIGYWDNYENWSTGISSDDASGSTYTWTIKPNADGKVYFRIQYNGYDYYPRSDGKNHNFGPGESTYNVNDYSANYTGSSAFEITNCTADQVIIKFTVGNPCIVTVIYENKTYQWESRNLKVYPNGRYTKSEITSSDFPVYYLQSMVLNNNRITPEYQFVKVAENQYELEFTYRNTTTEDEYWSQKDYNIWVEGFSSLNASSVRYDVQSSNELEVKSDNPTFKEGRRYKAKFNGSKLTFEDLNQQMPFISMIGDTWKQRVESSTPSPYGNKSTNDGFQEAWVQYNDRGQMARDFDGKVMYNTMWPPKNNIDFQTKFSVTANGETKEYNFGLETDQLVLKPGETHPGSWWKTNPESHFVKKGYTMSKLSDYIKGSEWETYDDYKKGLVLDDNTEYTLYKVDNMWINGRVKIWTGWGGVTGTNAVANWSWHSNWGHFKEHDRNAKATTIAPESSVPLSNREGDVTFSEPTFFKAVYFFYDKTNPSGRGRSIFFTELAKGGAEIAAGNDANYNVGYYRPGLTDIQGLAGETIAKIVIDCYQADGEKEYMGNVLTIEPNVAPTGFADLFDNYVGLGGKSKDDNTQKGQWVEYSDSREFPNGDYRYVMIVTLASGEEIPVESNPFTIFNSEIKTTLNAFQLVRIKGEGNPTYVTFRGTNGVPTTPVYQVEETSAGKYSYTQVTRMPDYGDAKTFEFTDLVLLSGNGHLSADEVLNYALVVNSKTLPSSPSWSKTGIQPQYDDKFMMVVTASDLAAKDYALGMQYKVNFTADGKAEEQTLTSTPGTANIGLTVPEPKLEDARVEVFYGSDNTGDTNSETADFVFTIGEGENARSFPLDEARYQNIREIVKVDLPNSNLGLSKLMDSNDAIKYYFNNVIEGKSSKKEEITIDENGMMTGHRVEPSTLFKNAEGGELDYRDVIFEKKEGINYFNRGWKDGRITSVRLTYDAPINDDDTSMKNSNSTVEVRNRGLYYDVAAAGDQRDPDLLEVFDVYIEVDAVNTNDLDHVDKNVPNDNLIHDYYYVAIYEIGTDSEGNKTETIAKDRTGKDAEFVTLIGDMNSDSDGQTVSFFKNHGPYYDGQIVAKGQTTEAADPYYTHLEVRVSYLYPFWVSSEHKANARGIFRTAENLTGTVIKSQATTYSFEGEVATGVENIEGVLNSSVKAGVGFIEVMGNDVEIYNAQGVKVAAGEGRHDVNAGVYVVRVSGQTHKVIVR